MFNTAKFPMNIVMLKLLAVHSKFFSRQLHYILEVFNSAHYGVIGTNTTQRWRGDIDTVSSWETGAIILYLVSRGLNPKLTLINSMWSNFLFFYFYFIFWEWVLSTSPELKINIMCILKIWRECVLKHKFIFWEAWIFTWILGDTVDPNY